MDNHQSAEQKKPSPYQCMNELTNEQAIVNLLVLIPTIFIR